MGNLDIDIDISAKLSQEKHFSSLSKEADEKEHSLEMQFPYVYQSVYSNGYKPKIVSIMVGSVNTETATSIGKMLLPYFDQDDTTFIISSDFCHWGSNFDYKPYSGTGPISDYIERLDKDGINHILKHDLEGFSNYIDTTENTICGRNPIMILLSMLQQSKLKIEGHELAYAQSGKIKNKNDNSVSYASIAFESL